MSIRFPLRGSSLKDLRMRVRNDFPPGSQIIEAENVTEGGIGGFLAKRYVEAIVEVPDLEVIVVPASDGTTPRPGANHAGIAALLRDADAAEVAIRGGQVAGKKIPAVSTTNVDCDSLMDGPSGSTHQDPLYAAHDEARVPFVLSQPGEIVMVIGLGADALLVAAHMAAAANASPVRTAGAFRAEGYKHVVSRLGLTATRADGILSGQAVFVAFGLSADGTVSAPALTEMDPDQCWLAVDATRKPADTESWIRRASWAAKPDALAVLNSANTLTPQSVNNLELPVGWLDDHPAARISL